MRLLVLFFAILSMGCGQQLKQSAASVSGPPDMVPWEGPVRLAVAGNAAFDAETEREVPIRVVRGLLSGLGVEAEVDCVGAERASGLEAVHAVVKVSFAAGTTSVQRRRAVQLLGSLAPQAEAFGEFLEEGNGRPVKLAGAAEVSDRGRRFGR